MIYEILLCCVVILLITLYTIKKRSPPGYPPGPIGIPFFGYVPFLSYSNPFRTMGELSKKYGDIFSIRFGPLNMVVLNTPELIREATKRHDLSGRPKLEVTRIWSQRTPNKSYGLAFNEGKSWSEQRRFTLRSLKDFGAGRKSMESLVLNEVHDLLDNLKTVEGYFMPGKLFEHSVINSLWSIVAGFRYSSNDPVFKEMAETFSRDFAAVGYLDMSFFFPGLAKMFPKLLRGPTRVAQACKNIIGYLNDEINRHRKRWVSTDIPCNYMDIYIKEINETADPESSFYKDQGYLHMVSTVMDLFGAGVETTSISLSWACLYLASFPEVQKKVHEELDRVIGNRLPVLSDKDNLPYMEATMNEVLRLSALLPAMLMRRVTEDTEFHGYFLPKDTALLTNSFYVLHCPKYWERPEEFYPEHFLNPDGTFRGTNDAFTAFGAGKRACPGEGTARLQFFLFLSNILHTFDIELAPGPKPSLDFEPPPGFTCHPKPYKIRLRHRH